jgi:RHH-type rel operon transcriptional repressor/antitoxin RelB
MTVSLRLDDRLAKQLDAAARKEGVSKSEFVRRCLAARLSDRQTRPSAWELGKDLFGRYSSGRSDLAQRSEEIVRELVHAKAHRR